MAAARFERAFLRPYQLSPIRFCINYANLMRKRIDMRNTETYSLSPSTPLTHRATDWRPRCAPLPPEQYEIHLAQLIDQRVAARRAALTARDEKTMREVADEMLEQCLESRQFLELLAVAPLESQAVVGKRFANLLEQCLVTEAHDWAVREAAAGARRRIESHNESRIDRAIEAQAA